MNLLSVVAMEPSEAAALRGYLQLAAMLGSLVLLEVALLLSIAKPWRNRTGSAVDTVRIAGAVLRYDLLLSIRGVAGKRRVALREELRANLVDAAREVGGRQALRGLGPLRELAAAADPSGVPAEVGRPRWALGAMAATYAFGIVLTVQALMLLGWMQAAFSSNATRISGGLPLSPGSRVVYSSDPGGSFAWTIGPGWLCLAAAASTFLVVARPWRVLRRAGSRRVPA